LQLGQLRLLTLQLGGEVVQLLLELLDDVELRDAELLGLAAVDLLRVDLDEERLVFLVVPRLLLLRAEPLDLRVTGAHLQVELPLPRLGFLQLLGGRLDLGVEVGDAAGLEADVLGGRVQPLLGFAELQIGLVQLHQRDVRRTHCERSLQPAALACVRRGREREG
jgi:hypothetical protein